MTARPAPLLIYFMIIGIDPGFTGAIAFLTKTTLEVFDLPLSFFMNKRQIDAREFSKLITDRLAKIKFAVIEDVHSMPNQGIASTFRFGYNAGILLGVLHAHDIEVLKLKPAVWKSSLNLSSDKRKSLTMAKNLFPKNKKDFTRLKDDGRAEAALLAYIGRETFL